ncbi:MAG: hypothetical protein AB1805_00595 [Nitrospirota bacterium]
MKMEQHETFGMVGNPSKLKKRPGRWQSVFFILAAVVLACLFGLGALLWLYL